MPFAERNLPLSAALVACLGLFGQPAMAAEEISIPGIEEGAEVLRALAIAFGGPSQGRLVLVPPASGSGRAVADVMAERAVFARLNRPLNADEKAAGLELREIFELPVLVIVHPDLNIFSLSLSDLVSILAGARRDWRELGASPGPIRVVMHSEIEPDLPINPAIRLAEVRHAREVEDLVRRVPGSIGLTTLRAIGPIGSRPLAIDGLSAQSERYPLKSRIRLAYRSGALSQASRDFLAFLHSERARNLIAGQGARPVLP